MQGSRTRKIDEEKGSEQWTRGEEVEIGSSRSDALVYQVGSGAAATMIGQLELSSNTRYYGPGLQVTTTHGSSGHQLHVKELEHKTKKRMGKRIPKVPSY
jgi:hypothetical protein